MEPDDTIDAIREKDAYTSSDVDCLRQLTERFPADAYLWDVLGDISQLAGDATIGDEFSLECYLNAVNANPNYGPAHNSLGHWYDIAENYPLAKRHFDLAIQNDAGDVARIGLSRVLAQMGHAPDAIAELDHCADQTAFAVVDTRREIADGLYQPYNDDDDSSHDVG